MEVPLSGDGPQPLFLLGSGQPWCWSFLEGLGWESLLLASWVVFGLPFVIHTLWRQFCASQMFIEHNARV